MMRYCFQNKMIKADQSFIADKNNTQMKNINNFKYKAVSVCLFALAVIIAGCKNYLEVNPVSSFGSDYVFSNVANVQNALMGVYSTLGGDNGYGIRLSMYYPYDNDEMMGQGATPYPDNERRDIAHYRVQPSNTQLAEPWAQLYRGIERANVCIYNIPKMEMYTSGSASDQKQLRRFYGEALALRAQMYFELMRNWGDVPAYFLPASEDPDLFKGKTDRDSIYNKIIGDLAEAETLVPWRTEASNVSNERLSQGAIRALRARLALFRGGYSLRKSKQMERRPDSLTFYQIARDECAVIMQHTADHKLNPNYQAVFKDALDAHTQEPNGEILWEIGMSGGSTAYGDSKLGYYDGPRLNGSTGNGALTVLPTYFYSFDPNDSRRDVTCAPYNISSDGTIQPRTLQTMVDGKFRRDWITNPSALTSNAQYFGINWPVIRYSDVLLMFAEAENAINHGPTAAAKTAFEQVRLRAFGGNANLIGTTPSDYQGFFNAIVNERRWEFGAEGIRKYDLIRWNLLGTKLQAAKDEMAKMVAHTELPYSNYPTTMYFQNNSKTLVWLNSLYQPAPSSAPAGSGSVSWIGSGITTTILTYFAIDFTPNKSELLPIATKEMDANPNLTQDYGY